MYSPLQLLPCIMCGTFKDFLHELNFWMSSGGTRSVIHFDADHNVHCLVAGRKDFMMIDPKFSEYLNVTQVSNGDVFTSNTHAFSVGCHKICRWEVKIRYLDEEK